MQISKEIKDIYQSAKRDVPLECIEACALCEFACLACADTCLRDSDLVATGRCIRLSLDCAESCLATRSLIGDGFRTAARLLEAQLGVCMRNCQICAAECMALGFEHQQASACARACEYCERVCREASSCLRNLS